MSDEILKAYVRAILTHEPVPAELEVSCAIPVRRDDRFIVYDGSSQWETVAEKTFTGTSFREFLSTLYPEARLVTHPLPESLREKFLRYNVNDALTWHLGSIYLPEKLAAAIWDGKIIVLAFNSISDQEVIEALEGIYKDEATLALRFLKAVTADSFNELPNGYKGVDLADIEMKDNLIGVEGNMFHLDPSMLTAEEGFTDLSDHSEFETIKSLLKYHQAVTTYHSSPGWEPNEFKFGSLLRIKDQYFSFARYENSQEDIDDYIKRAAEFRAFILEQSSLEDHLRFTLYQGTVSDLNYKDVLVRVTPVKGMVNYNVSVSVEKYAACYITITLDLDEDLLDKVLRQPSGDYQVTEATDKLKELALLVKEVMRLRDFNEDHPGRALWDICDKNISLLFKGGEAYWIHPYPQEELLTTLGKSLHRYANFFDSADELGRITDVTKESVWGK